MSGTRPAVSVVIPVFNRPHAVCRAIASVRAQTFEDFEIVVVDDASTDDTVAALRAIPDQRISVVSHPQRRGGGAARNTGIAASSGRYIAFLDSDDEWLPTKLARDLSVFARAGDRVALVYCCASRVYPDGTVVSRLPTRQYDLPRDLLFRNVVGETSVGMVRRDALDAVGGFDEALPSCQDIDLWLRICSRFDAELVPETLVTVIKGSDPGRISADVSRTLLGRDMFLRKHRTEMVRRRVLHLHLRETGWWQHRRAGNPTQARRYYAQSVKAYPLSPLSYLLLLSTWIPLTWLDSLARARRLALAPRRVHDATGRPQRAEPGSSPALSAAKDSPTS